MHLTWKKLVGMIILQYYFLHDKVELLGDLQIFGLITLPLVINYVLLG